VRQPLRPSAAAARVGDVRQPLRLSAAAARVGYFLFHFAEMLVAMMLGMMVFVPFRLALTAQGYAALLDASSIDFQAWMGAFMLAPMVTWMRVRGCSWRDGAEMSGAMLLPMAAVLALRGLGLSDTLPWLANSEHAAMLLGMLVLMLCRRGRYTSGYSFLSSPAVHLLVDRVAWYSSLRRF
jgi:flagellar biosynthetic protein FliP